MKVRVLKDSPFTKACDEFEKNSRDYFQISIPLLFEVGWIEEVKEPEKLEDIIKKSLNPYVTKNRSDSISMYLSQKIKRYFLDLISDDRPLVVLESIEKIINEA